MIRVEPSPPLRQTLRVDIVEFLTERENEREAVALAASPGPWHPNAESDEVWAVDDVEVCGGFALSNRQLRATVDHISRHDPTWVLADVAAKRAVIEFWSLAYQNPRDRHMFGGPEWDKVRQNARWTLWKLAQSHADHPDFDPTWKVGEW